MGVAEFGAALPLQQFVEQGQRFGVVHSLDTDDIARAAEQPFAAGFGMRADQRMALRRHRFVARADIHAAPLDRKSTPSELQSLMRISYAGFCLKKNTILHI